MREMVMKNQRAAYTLEQAQPESEWLSASWERFGRQHPSPANGLLAIGDSAAFIDPFTGSGMLMAFESGETSRGGNCSATRQIIDQRTMRQLRRRIRAKV
jgi:hypothetical protein